MRSDLDIFFFDVVEQPAGNGLIGLGNQSHCRTALLELIEDTSNDPLVFLMVPLMVLIIRIAILTLELFLITEVIGNVVIEEFQSLADLTAALAFSTGQQQIVDCVNQLFVLAVDQVVSGFKLRCELIGLDLGSLAGRLSLLHRPDGWSPRQAARLTTMAAVAVCEAIESVAGRPAGIKWVNDIFMDGKKVCGILTEASFGLEDGLLEYAVLGVGINVYPPKGGLPQELSSIAGSVLPGPVSDGKNRLAGAFLNRLMDYYTGDMDRYTDQYRQRSLVAGRDVLILSPKGQVRARALDVDRECRLVVRYEDGREDRLSSGEISVRFSAPEPPTDR